MKYTTKFVDILQCPVCQASQWNQESKSLQCQSCQQVFPDYGDITWFFKDPDESVRDWQNRFNYFSQATDIEVLQLKTELKQDRLLATTQNRLQKLIQAKIEHNREVLKIMEPIRVTGHGQAEHSIALKVKLPETQALMSYYSNVLRDWSYGDEENQICLDLILKTIGPEKNLGSFGVFGAGACRLPYDVHRSTECERTIAVDINPYLFYVAKRALSGKNLTLYEFPMAPVNLDAHGVKLKCKAPTSLKDGFHFLLADAMNPSFVDHAFDTIMTPWIIDIVHQDIRDLFRRFNRILKVGGRWINFGSLAFFHRQFHLCYSLEETLEIVKESGFEVERHFQEDIPYLHSPYSSQKRTEKVVSFCAKKIADIDQPEEFHYLPKWLLNLDEPIPLLTDLQQQVLVNQTLADVFRLIDGKRSLTELARDAAPQLQLPIENVQTMLRGLLTKFFEDRLRGRQF
ncbi:MAG: methyltransferase domain-containing protein [Oligoflexus sp.]